jgi:hypothetical protein
MRFAQADDPDIAGAPRENHRVEPHANEAKSRLAQFTIIFSIPPPNQPHERRRW